MDNFYDLTNWRRRWDSNPRYLSVHTLSKRARSTALPRLRTHGYSTKLGVLTKQFIDAILNRRMRCKEFIREACRATPERIPDE